jgi:glycosyltransferase involved in cell wall biosynthesis
MSDPLITVVVPLHNGAAFLAETLDSLAAQTRRDLLEVMVVDDGSRDEGPALARAHPTVDGLVHQPNSGVAVARNHGLSLARTRWVTFLDQDDVWHPTRVERVVARLEADHGIRLAATTEIEFGLEDEREGMAALAGTLGEWARVHARRGRVLEDLIAVDVSGSGRRDTLGPAELMAGPVLVTTSFVAEADLLRHAGGFAPHALAMDDYWLLVNAVRLTPLVRFDEPTVFYRVHLASTSRDTALAMPFLTSALALRHGGVLPEEPPGPFHRHLLEEVLGSSVYRDSSQRRRVIRHVAAALFSDGSADARLRRSEVKRLLPWTQRVRAQLRRP